MGSMSSRPRRIVVACERVAVGGVLLFVTLLPFLHLSGPVRLAYRYSLVVATIAWTAACVLQRRVVLPRSAVLPAAAAFVAVSFLSVLTSYDPASSLHAFSRFALRGLVLCVLVAALFREETRQRWLAAAIATSGLLFAGSAALLFSIGTRNPWGGLVGLELDYNSLCMWLLPTLPFALSLAPPAPGGRWTWTLAAAALLLSIAMSFSRIGWVATACALVLWAWLQPARRATLALATAFPLTLFLLAGPPLANAVTVTDNHRFLLDETHLDASVMKRMSWYDVFTLNDRLEFATLPALDVLRRRPWLGAGYGPGTFAAVAEGDVLLSHEHNILLAVGVQSGGLGIAAAVVLVALALRAAWRTRRQPGSRGALAAAVLVAVVAEYVVQGLGEPNFNTRMGILLFVLAGLAAALEEPADSPEVTEQRAPP
jgi:O-antigen ligase